MSSESSSAAPHPSLHFEELDLTIHDMDSEADELQVQAILQKLPGIHKVRLVSGGAWIQYNPLGISSDEICTAIRQSGFRASTFQDSKSGKTGLSSQ